MCVGWCVHRGCVHWGGVCVCLVGGRKVGQLGEENGQCVCTCVRQYTIRKGTWHSSRNVRHAGNSDN